MKPIICSIILLSCFNSCFCQIKTTEIDRKRAIKSDIMHFFDCMTSNIYYEKIAKNNYYIFDIIDGGLYYGRVHSGFFKGRVTEIFKVDVNALSKQIPNFRNLDGALLREIVLSDILKLNGLNNQSEIIVKNISFKLDIDIIVFLDFMINGKMQQKMYKLDTVHFKIVN